MRLRHTLTMVIFGLSLPAIAYAADSLEARLKDFQENPSAFMDRLPPKRVNRPGSTPQPRFSPGEIFSGDFVEIKSSVGPQADQDVGLPTQGILGSWKNSKATIEKFAGTTTALRKLSDIEERGLMGAELKVKPWSGPYWPISRGILATRYSAIQYDEFGHDWKTAYDFSNSVATLKKIFDSGDPEALKALSPSEKYDLLIGNLLQGSNVYENGFMTPFMWKQGQKYYQQYGSIETWMGICHGWAQASFMAPRPTNTVTVKAADGKTDLRFYPADLKGLTSYLWSMDTTPTVMMGQRCQSKKPKKDPKTGRILDERCFDVNPANWHLALVNRLGMMGKSFVLDSTFDYEVWNQPVLGYRYRYFNPQTFTPTATLSDAKVAISDFSNDKFRSYRSASATSIVGIEMEMTFVSETAPTHNEVDSADYDLSTTVTYLYDLEIDASGNVIGGEWYGNIHPDFLWAPSENSHAYSKGDAQLTIDSGFGSWAPGQPLPSFWREIAVSTAIHYGQPLAAVLDVLIDESRNKEN